MCLFRTCFIFNWADCGTQKCHILANVWDCSFTLTIDAQIWHIFPSFQLYSLLLRLIVLLTVRGVEFECRQSHVAKCIEDLNKGVFSALIQLETAPLWLQHSQLRRFFEFKLQQKKNQYLIYSIKCLKGNVRRPDIAQVSGASIFILCMLTYPQSKPWYIYILTGVYTNSTRQDNYRGNYRWFSFYCTLFIL